MDWIRVFLVARLEVLDTSPFTVIEREGFYLPEHRCWNVNLREPGCGSKLIQSVPEEKVYRTREEAETRLRAIDRLKE